jgi:hypothetical protein
MKISDEQFKNNLDSITEQDVIDYRAGKIKNIQARSFKQNHDAIYNSLNSKQYFKWHNEYFHGELDYKSMAFEIFHSTRSKKVRALCMIQIKYYDSVFGTSGFGLKSEKAV